MAIPRRSAPSEGVFACVKPQRVGRRICVVAAAFTAARLAPAPPGQGRAVIEPLRRRREFSRSMTKLLQLHCTRASPAYRMRIGRKSRWRA